MLRTTTAVLSLAIAAAVRQNVTCLTTSYGAKDNCPPGGDIAHPVIHKLAGGVGTYADPITYAGDTAATPAGTIVYVWALQKYFIMEDDCQECASNWKKHKKWHIDLWMGPDVVTPGPNLIACENAITATRTVEIDAPGNYPVDVTPLFNGTSLECIIPAPPCNDVGNTCGNDCQIPNAGTCLSIADELLMNYTRFLQLNPTVDCANNHTLPAGTTVCMGGSCGD